MSPFYPDDYPNNQDCWWRIHPSSPSDRYISIKFKKFSLAKGDVVTIGYENDTITFTDSSLIPNSWVTPCTDYVCDCNFMSDQRRTSKGFLIDIKSQERTSGKHLSTKLVSTYTNKLMIKRSVATKAKLSIYITDKTRT